MRRTVETQKLVARCHPGRAKTDAFEQSFAMSRLQERGLAINSIGMVARHAVRGEGIAGPNCSLLCFRSRSGGGHSIPCAMDGVAGCDQPS
jgi:hypothetical protein